MPERSGPTRWPWPWCWWQVWQFLAKSACAAGGVARQPKGGLVARHHRRSVGRGRAGEDRLGTLPRPRDPPGVGGPRGWPGRARRRRPSGPRWPRRVRRPTAGEASIAPQSSRRVPRASSLHESRIREVSSAPPDLPTARAAADWRLAGWSARSSRATTGTASSGRPRTSASRAIRRCIDGLIRERQRPGGRPERGQPLHLGPSRVRRPRPARHEAEDRTAPCPRRGRRGAPAIRRRPEPVLDRSRRSVSTRPSNAISSGSRRRDPDDRRGLREQPELLGRRRVEQARDRSGQPLPDERQGRSRRGR